MAEERIIKKWVCDICGSIFTKKDSAEECEESHMEGHIKEIIYPPYGKVPITIYVKFQKPGGNYSETHKFDLRREIRRSL